MRFSVVIPTYNRRDKLLKCLEALFLQDFPQDDYEIIVVDDGSSDDTQALLKECAARAPVKLTALHQKNQGQGVARNTGARAAKGEIILLLGDDIYAQPGLLAEHDRIHKKHPQKEAAVLGFVTWDPALTITPLMRFMEKGGAIFGRWGGHQFAYDLLKGKEKADHRFFYTANISLKRELCIKHPFDPWFAGYGWEDIELGLRLEREAGMVLYYAPHARALHDHAMNQHDFAKRMRDIARSSYRIHERYPECGFLPSKRKRLIFKIISNGVVRALTRYLWPDFYYYSLSKKYFIEGLTD